MRAALVIGRRLGVERRLLVIGVAAGAMLTLFLQVAMYPAVRDSFGDMTDDLPEAFTRLTGAAEFTSPEGFLQAEAYGTMAPILVLLVAISTAAGGLAGTERAGRMDLIATSPLSRREIAVGAALSAMGAVTIVVLAYWTATLLGSAIGELHIGIAQLTAAALSLWLLGLATGGIAFAVGGISGRRGLAVGTAASVAIGSYLAYGLLPLSDRFSGGRYASLWYPYADHQPLLEGIDLSNAAVLLVIAVVGVMAGIGGFDRRDIA